MKKLLLILAALGIAVPAYAGPQVLSWDASPTAVGYGIEQSIDNGTSWQVVSPTEGPVCSGTPSRCTATVTAPATGYVLYRVSASNAYGTTIRYTAGLWVCESCVPPPAAANIGVK